MIIKREDALSYFKYLVIYAAVLLILYASKFWPLSITNEWTLDSSLGDLESNLKWMRCSVIHGSAIYEITTPDGCGGYTYGFVFARFMGQLGINETYASEIRFLFFVLFLFILALNSVYLEKQTSLKTYFIALVLFSPPAWLSLIHGSLDIPVLFLINLAWILAKRFYFISFMLIALTCLMKYFTIALLFYLGFRIISTSSSNIKRFFVLSVTIFISINIIIDYFRVDWSNPSYRIASGIFFVFGIESPINWMLVIIKKLFNQEVILFNLTHKIGALIVFIILLYIFYKGRRHFMQLISAQHDSSKTNEREYFFDFSFHFLPLIVLFIQGQNWDNKMIFLSTPALLTLNQLRKPFLVPFICCAFYFTNFWPFSRDSFFFTLSQLIGDLSLYTILVVLTIHWLTSSELGRVLNSSFKIVKTRLNRSIAV